MNKDDDIRKKVLATDNEQLAKEHFPEDIHSPHPETISDKPETEKMEVHKHPHHVTHKKKWQEYLLEFLMLFLAVFLGFLAENQREHMIEHQREKQYAKQLLADLRKDSAFFSNSGKLIEAAFKKSWIRELFVQQQHPSDIEIIRNFIKVFRSFDESLTNTTFAQMKASGSLRYIKNTLLTGELQKYYDVLSAEVVYQSEVSRKFLSDYMLPWYLKHLRAQDFDGQGDAVLNNNTPIIDRTDKTDQEVLNITDTYRRINLGIHEATYKPAALQAETLIIMLKKEYHLE